MFKIVGMRSWNLNADDLEEMVTFYRDKLGVQESGRQTIAGANVVRLRAGEQGIGLFARRRGRVLASHTTRSSATDHRILRR